MNGGRGDRCVTCGHRKLVKIADNVAGGVEILNSRPLMYVDGQIANRSAIRAQAGSQLRADLASERWVKDVKIEALAARDRDPHAVSNTLSPNEPAGPPDAGSFQRGAHIRRRGLLTDFEERDVAGIGPQE